MKPFQYNKMERIIIISIVCTSALATLVSMLLHIAKKRKLQKEIAENLEKSRQHKERQKAFMEWLKHMDAENLFLGSEWRCGYRVTGLQYQSGYITGELERPAFLGDVEKPIEFGFTYGEIPTVEEVERRIKRGLPEILPEEGPIGLWLYSPTKSTIVPRGELWQYLYRLIPETKEIREKYMLATESTKKVVAELEKGKK